MIIDRFTRWRFQQRDNYSSKGYPPTRLDLTLQGGIPADPDTRWMIYFEETFNDSGATLVIDDSGTELDSLLKGAEELHLQIPLPQDTSVDMRWVSMGRGTGQYFSQVFTMRGGQDLALTFYGPFERTYTNP